MLHDFFTLIGGREGILLNFCFFYELFLFAIFIVKFFTIKNIVRKHKKIGKTNVSRKMVLKVLIS